MANHWDHLQRTVLRLTISNRQYDLVRLVDRLSLPLSDLYERVLQPVMGQIEARWFASDLTLAREWHIFGQIERLVDTVVPWPKTRKPYNLLACTVAGEGHGLGVRMVANLFDEAGWRIVDLGPDAPAEVVLALLETRTIHAAAFSVSLAPFLPALGHLLADIQKRQLPTVILVGGPALTGPDAQAITAMADVVNGPLATVVARTESRLPGRRFTSPPPANGLPPCVPRPEDQRPA
jgi:methanogenic corrinoid protein MtbC1